MGSKVCGCIIGTGNGIERFCVALVEDGKHSCSVKAHANKPKATSAPVHAWYVTTTMRGRSGGPAAVRSKFIKRTEAHPSFWESFKDGEKTPQEWEGIFDRARLAQAIGEEDAAKLTGNDDSGRRVDPMKYVTPRKRAPISLHQDSPNEDGLDSWEGFQNASLPALPEFMTVDVSTLNSPALGAGKDINVKRALQAIQDNFSTLGEHLSTQSTLLSNNFEEVTNRLNIMAVESSSLGRRIGIPAGFGAEDAVTTAFDGLRFLHEQIETVTEPFSRVSFTTVVEKLGKVESELALLNTVKDQDELEHVKQEVLSQVAENKKQTGKTFETLKTRFVGPMAKFYGEAISAKGTIIFERLGAVETAVKDTSDDGNLFGAISYMGGLTSNGEFGSPRQTQALEKRMAEIEHKNLELTTELETLKEHRASAVANKIGQAPQDAKVDGLMARLSLLEVQDGDAIRIGTYTFTNVVDCEAFLSAKVPANVLSAYC